MWLLFTFAYAFFLALVNYIDEYLTAHHALPETTDVHTRIGGLVIMSTLMTAVGAIAVWFFADSILLSERAFVLSLAAGVPLALLWVGYFYLLTFYPVYQVIPLFQLSSVWLLVIELVTGGSITTVALLGVAMLIVGAYFLDAGTIRWQIPTALLLLMLPTSLLWSINLYMVKVASIDGTSVLAITFWQFIGVALFGVLMFVFVRQYRNGFLFRLKKQRKTFLGFSVLNEGAAEAGYFSGNMATALAPLATYFSALGGLQSVFLLVIFYFFPQKPLSINQLQVMAICMIAVGIFLLEGWKYV